MKDNYLVSLLKELNLTEYEAKALVTLFKFSESDAPTISRNSEIPKTRIYDVLDRLKDKGFVLEVYKSPKTYKIVNPEEIFKGLLDLKQNELLNLSKKVDDVILNSTWSSYANSNPEKVLQVNNIKDYNKFLSQEFETAEKEIHGFTNLDERIDSLKSVFTNKNLSINILTNPVTKIHEIPKHVTIQETNHSMDAFVLDKKKVIMALNDLSSPKKAYNLTVLENNPTLANALLSHFKDYWKK
ncbi:TrmB family transcriptional regulator [archaeon]|nr:TrmB family transcriptional regulator [archaeon]NCP79553.1 TrmB family transcriptional regulator [archaeon]NCP97497.1 TrmB family transcriptional regulator [archaeon]NCQ07320.1 TrmB family transcriptional regulator [archaeon]NCQ51116.1 TrmB family transcriptional regulator [archaeon]